MPELPEVETVRKGLLPAMEGGRIVGLELKRPDLRFPFPAKLRDLLLGRVVVTISRRAKYLLFHLDDQQTLLAHLGMSGSFRVVTASAEVTPGEFHHLRSKLGLHDHVVMEIEHHEGQACQIIYNDPRRFGFMDLVMPGLDGAAATVKSEVAAFRVEEKDPVEAARLRAEAQAARAGLVATADEVEA